MLGKTPSHFLLSAPGCVVAQDRRDLLLQLAPAAPISASSPRSRLRYSVDCPWPDDTVLKDGPRDARVGCSVIFEPIESYRVSPQTHRRKSFKATMPPSATASELLPCAATLGAPRLNACPTLPSAGSPPDQVGALGPDAAVAPVPCRAGLRSSLEDSREGSDLAMQFPTTSPRPLQKSPSL